MSLGRLIQRGIKLEWTKDGASLVLPNKRKVVILVRNNFPYANQELLKIVKKLREIEETSRKVRVFYAIVIYCFEIQNQDSAGVR